MTTTFAQTDYRVLAGHLEATAIALAIAFVVWRIAIALTDRFFARRFVSRYLPRVATFCTLSKSMIGLVIIVLAVLELLNIWTVNVAPAVWSAGFVTAALAFGSQNLVRDIVTGFFFLFEDQYDVGDRVEIVTAGGQLVAGTVGAMELRTTRIIDRQGRWVVIPNGTIALVTNASRQPTAAGFTLTLPWKDDASSMHERILSYARSIASDMGQKDARISVALTDTAADHAAFTVEMRTDDPESDVWQAQLRERLADRLQADGWLPGRPAAPTSTDAT